MYAVLCLAAQSCLTFCNPMGCSLPEHLCPWRFSRQGYWSGLPCPPPLSQPGIEPRSPALRVDSLLSESPGKHMPDSSKNFIHTHSQLFLTTKMMEGLGSVQTYNSYTGELPFYRVL